MVKSAGGEGAWTERASPAFVFVAATTALGAIPAAVTVTTATTTTAAVTALTAAIAEVTALTAATTAAAWSPTTTAKLARAATGAFFLRPGFHDFDGTAANILIVEKLQGLAGFRIVRHLNKAKATGAPRFTVHNYAGAGDGTVGFECRL